MLNRKSFWAEYEDIVEKDIFLEDLVVEDNLLIIGSKRGKLSEKFVKKDIDVYALEEDEENIKLHYRRLNYEKREKTHLIHGYLTYFDLRKKFKTILFYEELFYLRYEEIYNFFKMLNNHFCKEGRIVVIKYKETKARTCTYKHPHRKTKIFEEIKVYNTECMSREEIRVEEYDKDLLLNRVEKEINKIILNKGDIDTIFNRNGYLRVEEYKDYYIIKKAEG